MRDRKIKMLGLGVIAAVVITTLVMLLWNALLPVLFGVQSIGFFQALGLLMLCRLLFGGIGGRGMFWRHGHEMRERWMSMSPEQREAFFSQRGFAHHQGRGCRGHDHAVNRHARHGGQGRDERQRPTDAEGEKPTDDNEKV